MLADLICRIVAIEGPIHVDEVARQISTAFGKNHTGSRISDAVNRAVGVALGRDQELRKVRSFLLTRLQTETPPVRDRSGASGSIMMATYLPPMEIKAAARRVIDESGEMLTEGLVRAVRRLLGFQRVGPDLQVTILRAALDPAE